eukprot:SAG31_NODE_1079_length_10031_cov_5.270741_9_plen_203_part_00
MPVAAVLVAGVFGVLGALGATALCAGFIGSTRGQTRAGGPCKVCRACCCSGGCVAVHTVLCVVIAGVLGQSHWVCDGAMHHHEHDVRNNQKPFKLYPKSIFPPAHCYRPDEFADKGFHSDSDSEFACCCDMFFGSCGSDQICSGCGATISDSWDLVCLGLIFGLAACATVGFRFVEGRTRAEESLLGPPALSPAALLSTQVE